MARLGDMFDLHVTPFLPEVFGDETAMAVMRLFVAAKQAAVVCERFPSPYARGDENSRNPFAAASPRDFRGLRRAHRPAGKP
jgi:hypothetical protein